MKTIAFHYVEQGLLELDIDGLEKQVEPLLKSLTKPVSARSLIRQIYERSGVLVEQAIGKYGFAHRALHDYLAASHIAEQNMDALLVDHAAEERWREVILIAIGLVQPKQRAEALLSSLLNQSDKSAASLALAGWSLSEDIQISETLRNSVVYEILNGVDRATDLSDFALLSSALFDTEPRAFRAWVKSILVGKNPNWQKHLLTTILPSLGLEQSKPYVATLTKILADPQAETKQRTQCALTLAKLKPEADSELWNALNSARQQKKSALKLAATWAYCELGRFDELGLVKIPEGEFLMGSSEEDGMARDEEKPQHTLYLPAYYIGKYPVTVDEYRAFLQDSGYKPQYEKQILSGAGNHPVAWVFWKDALAFAQWKGLTLPSEAEWEKAARGADGRLYPWGNTWQSGLANSQEYWNSGARGLWSKLRRRDSGTTTPVGTFSPRGDSPYGCADMSGNVWEWCHSLYKPYPYNAEDSREDETASGSHSLRGGAYWNGRSVVRCAIRVDLNFLGSSNGFRVCASPISPE